jgi:catechol 2,3-dioxygenase-like lactoylglutathione lyase family enzyme
MDMKLEVVIVPVSDVDRAKDFYTGLGWREDADLSFAGKRVVQLTPPGSDCSIMFGSGITDEEPGSLDGTLLVVDDIEAAREDLASHGAPVSEIFHGPGARFLPEGSPNRMTGVDPEGDSYRSHATFSDPDGNGWAVQQVVARLPGRIQPQDSSALAGLLRETEEHHGPYEAKAPKHHWSDWYAAYMVARQAGQSPEEADAYAGKVLEAVLR